jgi:hypothetical protein
VTLEVGASVPNVGADSSPAEDDEPQLYWLSNAIAADGTVIPIYFSAS